MERAVQLSIPHRPRCSPILLALALIFAVGCGGGGGGSGGDDNGGDGSDGGDGGGGGMPPGGPPTVIQSSLGSCSGRAVDRWTFETLRGQDVTFRVDTIGAATAADLCLRGRCGAAEVSGDDEFACTFPSPGFGCPKTEITTRRAGTCTFDVTTCSDACANSGSVNYEITVGSTAGGPELTQVRNDASADSLSDICFDGPNDSQDCTNAGQCDPGTCEAFPAAPRPGRGEPEEGVDVPANAEQTCLVVAGLTNAVTYTSLKYKISYADASGGFPGIGAEVSCDRDAGGSGVFTDFDASKSLLVRLVSGRGVTGPQRLSTCRFMHASTDLDPGLFGLAVTEAIDLDGAPVAAAVELTVNCGDTTTTTMQTSSTVTLPDTTTTTTIPTPITTTTTSPEPTVSTTLEPGVTLPTSSTTSTTLGDFECGEFVTEWGSLGNSSGRFNMPVAVAVHDDRVFVVDRNNDRIQRFTDSGAFVSEWGSAGSTNGRFSNPTDIAIDGDGNVYVADTNNHRVQKFTASGGFLAAWGSLGDGDGRFERPVGVAAGLDEVYVVDSGNGRVQAFSPLGAYLRQFGSPGTGSGRFDDPRGLDVGGGGNILVADAGRDRILVFSSAGNFLREIGSSGSGDGRFNAPSDIAVRADGNLFVADTGNNRMQQLSSGGSFIAQWNGASAGQSRLSMPQSVNLGGSVDVYVADTRNHRIRKYRCR